jgi:hypothetical protein
MYRVIYKVRNEDRWAIWKARIHTYEEAEYRMQQVTRILGVPARIQLM